MTRVFLADPLIEERSALRILLLDLQMEMVGEASDWLTLMTQVGPSCPDMILLSWELLPRNFKHSIAHLRKSCPNAVIIAIANKSEYYQRAAQLAGVDAFISKEEFPLRVAAILRTAVKSKGNV
jgi:AmiR/NasT family two-component response regulator